ncbi:hypothetical protein [Saccharothrix sp. NRRL B-16314]|uniref:hypothetical protein n=1 Tax=Saccharothrix sp. NRRL B-16314 TaxID=1463825 RepID=UPI0005245BC9|nr:hypothetical protein [Saccharothrix sp. NRRL B-16314]
MEKTWKIRGAAATWKMTVAILPPEGEPLIEPLPEQPEPRPDFDGLVDHFHALVGMTEAQLQLEQLT